MSFAQVAKDFGISESCAQRWVTIAEVDDGVKPGATSVEHAENHELKKRIRLLEQENEDAEVSALKLNLFGRNLPAVAVYSSSGYAVTTQQMRKDLSR